MSVAQAPGAPPAPPQDVLIRNAYVMTMDPVLQDMPCGDVHIANGRIAAVGHRLIAPSALTIDGRDKVVMPGLIDSHTHLWSSQLRGCFARTGEGGYFNVRNVLADGYRPQDIYVATQLGATESLLAGTTTVVDFGHNNRGREYCEAALRALRESGIRARFLFGASTRTPAARTVDLTQLERLAKDWPSTESTPVSLGLAWRGPLGLTSLATSAAAPDVSAAREEIVTARRLGLPVSVHVSGHTSKIVFDSLRANDFLGPDLQLVHFTAASREDIDIARSSGVSLSLTPITELRTGYGVTAVGDYLDGGMRTGLGVDSGALAGTSSLFEVMKLTQLIECGRLGRELALPARRLLDLVTLEGARSLGMDHEIGSLTPGKRADLIVVASDALNMVRAGSDPAQLLIESTQPQDVETVLVAGHILKNHGVLTRVDRQEVTRRAQLSLASITQRADSMKRSNTCEPVY